MIMDIMYLLMILEVKEKVCDVMEKVMTLKIHYIRLHVAITNGKMSMEQCFILAIMKRFRIAKSHTLLSGWVPPLPSSV